MKNLYLIGALLWCLIGSAQCITNGDFENTAQYTNNLFNFTHKKNSNSFTIADCNVDTSNFTQLSLYPTPNQFGTSEPTGGTWTMSTPTAPVYDPLLLTAVNPQNLQQPLPIQMKVVSSGNRGLKLNNSVGGSDITSLKIPIQLTSTSISFDYSLLMTDHGTDNDSEAFFTARIINPDNNNIVSINELCIKCDPQNPLLKAAYVPSAMGNVYYTGWECGRLEIPQAFVNQELILEFITADCVQSLHFGTAYIDNITCSPACSTPATGLLSLNETHISCPTAPFQICGTYSPPEFSTLSAISLSIFDNNNVLVCPVITNTITFTSSTFCFNVNPATFSSTAVGNFEIRVDAKFNSTATGSTFVHKLFDTSSNPGPDISYTAIDMKDTYVSSGVIYWPDVSDTYELQFIADEVCCPGAGFGNMGSFYTTTVTDNFINGYIPAGQLQSKCYRWRIKAACGEWSEWCCLAHDESIPGNQVFGTDQFGNIYKPGCYNGVIPCEPTLYVTTSVSNHVTELRDISITALNTIQNNASATYLAGQFVLLQPGFNTQSGALFFSKIDDCSPLVIEKITTPKMRTNKEGNEMIKENITKESKDFIVYPNPTYDKINIENPIPVKLYSLIDISGKEVISVNNDNTVNKNSIDVSILSPGIYFLQADGILISKIIKN